jgi:uncharacterized protein YodC (DUF2158 family)
MAEETFQAGDLVELKSGGPVMTVEGEDPNSSEGTVVCSYFDSKKKLVRSNFSTAALKRAVSIADQLGDL